MMTLQQQLSSMPRLDKTRLPRTTLASTSQQPRVQATAPSTETRIIGKEEMSDLRKQLQTEAENIARWKASTEVKSKNMEREIKDKQSIIDDQRSNLMELQLHSEHLSQSLFQERQERELVNSKVGHTRQLFLTLQEQYEQLFETVSNFQTCKDDMHKEHDDLIEKLTDLKQSFQMQEEIIEDMISKAEENVSCFKDAKNSWENNVMEKDQEIQDLSNQLETLRVTAKQLSESLESTTVDLSSVEGAREQLSSELCEVKASLLRTQEELREQRENLTDQITKTDQELKLAREQLEERTKEFEEAAEKIQYLKKVNDTLEGSKSELAERVTALATRKQELEEEINFKENVIETLDTTQNKSLVEINELKERLSDMCTQLSMIEEQRATLELERNSVTEKLESSKKKLMKKKKLLEQFKGQVTTLQVDLEARMEAQTKLEEENIHKEETNHSLEMAINELNKQIIMCNDTISDMTQKLCMTENYEAQLQEEKKKLEEDLKKVSSELATKVQECEALAETITQLRVDMKGVEKECEEKVKNANSETKSRRLLHQKINGLEEKLKKSTQTVENLEAELKKTKNLLNKREKEAESLQLSLDNALCEKKECQSRYEAQEESFQSYQSISVTSLETLQKELDDTKEELEMTKNEHEQQVLQLQKELDETKESLNSSSIAHEKQLQETTTAFQEERDTLLAKRQKEITTLKAKLETMTSELEQAKQEASAAIKEKLQIKLESDNKVKEMGDLLDVFKTDKETKLKSAEEELQKSKSQIAQLIQEKDELFAKTKTLTQNSVVTATAKPTVTKPEDPTLRTPSPNTYLEAMDTFAGFTQPSIPPAPRASTVIRRTEADKFQQGKQAVSGILKTGRRTLLPPEYQKRVVFKPLVPIRDYASGDSSSEACTFEVADSDDPFDEIKRARRYPGGRSDRVPRANVAPFITETTPTQKSDLPLNEQNVNDKVNGEPAIGSSRRKRGRTEQKQNLKTYSAVSPKNKQAKAQ